MIAGGSYADAYGTAALPANTWTLPRRDLRRRDPAALRQRHPGRRPPPHTGTIATSTNPLQIGGDSIYGQYFPGMIDEVRVYNTALTASPDPDRHDHARRLRTRRRRRREH